MGWFWHGVFVSSPVRWWRKFGLTIISVIFVTYFGYHNIALVLMWLKAYGFDIIATLIVFYIGYRAALWFIGSAFRAWGKVHKIDVEKDARLQTWRELLVRALRATTIFLAFLAVLPQTGIDQTTLATGLGGLALVALLLNKGIEQVAQDIVAGFLVFVSDAFHVGEKVTIADNMTGTIEQMGLREVVLRNEAGEECTVPYRIIGKRTNHSRVKTVAQETPEARSST